MINALGIYSNYWSLPLIIARQHYPPAYQPTYVPISNGVQVGGNGNDTINIGGGGVGPPGPPGPIGPPGPPGTPGLVPVTTVTTTPFNVTLTDYLLDVNIPTPSSVVLPISPAGTVFIIKDVSGNASSNPITVTGLGALIDGAATALIDTNYGSVTLIFNSAEWNIV